MHLLSSKTFNALCIDIGSRVSFKTCKTDIITGAYSFVVFKSFEISSYMLITFFSEYHILKHIRGELSTAIRLLLRRKQQGQIPAQ